jgi:hypothetical protein
MRQEGSEIIFSTSEFSLSGLWSIPVSGVADAIIDLRRQQSGLVDESIGNSPLNGETGHRYAQFQRAQDVCRLADRLEQYLPMPAEDAADDFLRSLSQD